MAGGVANRKQQWLLSGTGVAIRHAVTAATDAGRAAVGARVDDG